MDTDNPNEKWENCDYLLWTWRDHLKGIVKGAFILFLGPLGIIWLLSHFVVLAK